MAIAYICVQNIWFNCHDYVTKWKQFPRYWPFVRGIHRSSVNSPHKDQWRRAMMFPLICVWINGWVNNREAGDLKRHRAHYDVTVMCGKISTEAECHTPQFQGSPKFYHCLAYVKTEIIPSRRKKGGSGYDISSGRIYKLNVNQQINKQFAIKFENFVY